MVSPACVGMAGTPPPLRRSSGPGLPQESGHCCQAANITLAAWPCTQQSLCKHCCVTKRTCGKPCRVPGCGGPIPSWLRAHGLGACDVTTGGRSGQGRNRGQLGLSLGAGAPRSLTLCSNPPPPPAPEAERALAVWKLRAGLWAGTAWRLRMRSPRHQLRPGLDPVSTEPGALAAASPCCVVGGCCLPLSKAGVEALLKPVCGLDSLPTTWPPCPPGALGFMPTLSPGSRVSGLPGPGLGGKAHPLTEGAVSVGASGSNGIVCFGKRYIRFG